MILDVLVHAMVEQALEKARLSSRDSEHLSKEVTDSLLNLMKGLRDAEVVYATRSARAKS